MHNLAHLSSLGFPFNHAAVNAELSRQRERAGEKTNTLLAHAGSRSTDGVLSHVCSQLKFQSTLSPQRAAASIQNKYETLHIDPRVNNEGDVQT